MPLQTMHLYEDASTNYVLDSNLPENIVGTESFSFFVICIGCRILFSSCNLRLLVSAAIKQIKLIDLDSMMKRPPSWFLLTRMLSIQITPTVPTYQNFGSSPIFKLLTSVNIAFLNWKKRNLSDFLPCRS